MAEQPMPNMGNVQQVYTVKKRALEEAFKEFQEKVFSSKVLDRNKSPAVKKTEVQIIDGLINAAVALNDVQYGEGLLALATISLREALAIKDRVNELEYELFKALREIKKLNKNAGVDDGKAKR